MAHGVVIRLSDAKSPKMSVHISKSFVNFLSDWCTVLLICFAHCMTSWHSCVTSSRLSCYI